MPIYDPGDVVYHPNTLRNDSKQVLGDVVVAIGSPTSGHVLTTARKFGPGATGVYNKYKNRMETDSISVIVA